MIDKHQRGQEGEAFTIDYLRSNGFIIAERNWRYHHSEVDIIAVKRGVMHFVEVKTRQSSTQSIEQALEAINSTKREALLNAANAYMRHTRLAGDIQFDLAAVETHLDGSFEMHYIENIFE